MHNRKLEEGIGGVMGISMNDLTAQKKLEKVNLIKRIITMVFGVGSVVMFFLPYAQFVFKDTKYVTSGLDLLIASGFRVETGTTSALMPALYLHWQVPFSFSLNVLCCRDYRLLFLQLHRLWY